MSGLSVTAEHLKRHYDTLITGDIHPLKHPVAKGDAREHGWRELFRRFLPDRYGVKSGFVIDSFGQSSDQIDCIVYRKDMGIELYSVGHHTVIPVEAVFGAFEIKPMITSTTLKYAEEKAATIAKLELTNGLVGNNTILENDLGKISAEGSIILGLLVDKIKAKSKWNVASFAKLISESNPKLSVFMTVEDGCVDTLNTGYPTNQYRYYQGNDALLCQLINIAESVAAQEQARCLSSCCLSKYKHQLSKPINVVINS